MSRTGRPLLVAIALALFASGCSGSEASEPVALKGWDGETIDSETVDDPPSVLATTDATSTTTTTAAVPTTTLVTSTTKALPPLTVPPAEPLTAQMVCQPLGVFYAERVVLRDELLTAGNDANSARLATMAEAVDQIPAGIPFFSWSDVSALMSVERIFPNRLGNGGAIWSSDIETNELAAERVNGFAREFCTEIEHDLISLPSVDELAEGVFAAEESARMVKYCAAADTILEARQDFIAGTASGTVDEGGREAYARFLSAFDDGRPTIESEGLFLEYATDSDYRLRLEGLYFSMVYTRQALGDQPIPINRHWSLDSNDNFAGQLLDSIATICPDLPSERFKRTSISDVDAKTLVVTPGKWQDRPDLADAEACPRAHMLLASYGALADLLAKSNGANAAHWTDLESYGLRVSTAASNLGDAVGNVLGSDARYVDVSFVRLGYAVSEQDLPSRGDQLRYTNDVATLATAAAEGCTDIPAELLSPKLDIFKELELRLGER